MASEPSVRRELDDRATGVDAPRAAIRWILAAVLIPLIAARASAAHSSVVFRFDLPRIDHIVVKKSERRLYLMDGNKVVRSFKIALGREPEGPKERSGDFRTPVGWYYLARRNPRSDYFLSILISYPNATDLQRAQAHNWPPGGSIEIHGLPNRLTNSPSYYEHSDWTNGCIAVSDADMMVIWMLTRDGMPIDILR